MVKISSYKITLLIFVIIIVLLVTYLNSKKGQEVYNEIPSFSFSEETKKDEPLVESKKLFDYIEIVDSCGHAYDTPCVNMRKGPGIQYGVVEKLRTGVVLPVSKIVTVDNKDWYKIKIETSVGFPERVTSEWYVASGDYVKLFKDEGIITSKPKDQATSTKRIIVDRSEQTLYAFDDKELIMKLKVSTGLHDTPTPRGKFTIFKKTPSRYMQGPLPGVSEQYYDLPGVPWDLYFTNEGAVIHGAYWHNSFGKEWSHGCVNLSPDDSKKLYYWADFGIPVIVQD